MRSIVPGFNPLSYKLIHLSHLSLSQNSNKKRILLQKHTARTTVTCHQHQQQAHIESCFTSQCLIKQTLIFVYANQMN